MVASFGPMPFSRVSVVILAAACSLLPCGVSAIEMASPDFGTASRSVSICKICSSTRANRSAIRRIAEEDGEARLYVVSEGKKATEDAVLKKKRSRFEAAFDNLHRGLSVKGRLKRYEKVLEGVGRLKQRFSKVAGHYEISVDKAAGGANAKALRYSRKKAYDDADERAGAYVLRTSHTDWDIETVLRTYWRITDIEATFQSLKSELGLRPIYHQLDRRIAAHLMIAVFAYHAVQLIRTRLAARGIKKCWTPIRESTRTWVRITTRLARTDGALIVNRQDTRPAAEVAEMALAAGATPALHRKRSPSRTDKIAQNVVPTWCGSKK